ncbi:MAG: hypothetical protein J5865_02605 [Lachnospiraceae bacterium]|nr:hypothetical protein [Lachnospiraceae bacterium]
MDNEWNHSEEFTPLPEHTSYPEYTPEYPDVTFFKESYVTSREENIFQGEVPPGESGHVEDLREERKEKRRRENWLRWFLSGLVKAGAVLLAIIILVAGAERKEEPEADTRDKFVKLLGVDLIKPPFTPHQDYSIKDLSEVWEADPEGPHKYDYDQVIVLREATCQEDGESAFKCSECGVLLKYATTKGHEPAPVVKENEVEPDCVTSGSYEEVIVCKDCGTELSRTKVEVPALGHTGSDAYVENIISPTCDEAGSCEDVIYCSVCGEEISRTKRVLDAVGHIGAEPIVEVLTEPGCTTEGSCEEIVLCAVCGEEISRTVKVMEPTGHTGGDPVEENTIPATCTEQGSCEQVVYCTVCNEEVSRTLMVLEPTGHTAADPVIENRVEATCTEEGGYDEVVYCSVCKEELSRAHQVLAAKGHTRGKAVKEKEQAATCTKDGSYESVVYCTVCKAELSRTRTVVKATGHTKGKTVKENEKAATCTKKGSYDEVVYCTVCKAELSRKTKTVAALGHNYTAKVTKATCTAKGYTTHTCSRCKDSYKDTYTDALGHKYTTKKTAATCTKDGYTTHTCSRCGDSYKDNYVDALGHNWNLGNWNESSVLKCSRCGTAAMTLKYSSRQFTITLNSDFAKQLKSGGYYGWFNVQTVSEYDTYTVSERRYWGSDASTPSTVKLSAEFDDVESGSSEKCRAYFMYSEGSDEGLAVSSTITVRIP